MAFSSTITGIKTPVRGGLRMVMGTYTDAAADGSDIVTGLTKVFFCAAMPDGQNAQGAKESATAGTITIYATNDGIDDGVWFAVGK